MPLTIGLIKKHICIIGVIRAILVKQTSVSYTIEDGTGAIDIRQWDDAVGSSAFTETEKSMDANEADVYPRDIYVKVYGRIQSYSDRIFYISFKTVPIKDFNEITFHYLDAIHVYLESTAIKNKTCLSSSNIQLSNSPFHKISRNNINGIVKRAIKVCGDEEVGSHISSIINHLKNMFDETQVMRSLNELAEEGQIYSLMDEYVQLVDL
ncbi:replication protein A 32 kDa subunit isoform X2 [Mucor ambiguus]|uniref:Replication protein A 32 kDa subunit isoform X2 n=1 Tax=Mucor ambiguus TaxID=91626 RepID=A0A0C9MUB5_9FUNG|nr:replication protein A 32 kDa subunit isoform X2 [Mucor ambiguus]